MEEDEGVATSGKSKAKSKGAPKTMSKGEAEQQVFCSTDADIRSQDAGILYGTVEAGGRILKYFMAQMMRDIEAGIWRKDADILYDTDDAGDSCRHLEKGC